MTQKESNDLLNAAVNAYGTALNYANQKEALEHQKTVDTKNLALSDKQFEESVRQYNLNRQQSDYWNTISQNNYLNASSIKVADMSRAGLNPLADFGASGVVISPSQTSGVAGSQVQSHAQAPQLDLSALTSILSHISDLKHDSEERKKDREVEREKIKSERDKWQEENLIRGMELDEKINSRHQQARQFKENLEQNLNLETANIGGANARLVTELKIKKQIDETSLSLENKYKIMDAMQNHYEFALACKKAEAEMQEFRMLYDQHASQFELEQQRKNFETALNNATRTGEKITGMGADTLKAFIFRGVMK